MTENSASNSPFDRPIIIVAAPRSGSTMLFETLCCAKGVWTIGGESHLVIEQIKKLNPAHGRCSSNRLTAEAADSVTVDNLRRAFLSGLRDRDGHLHSEFGPESSIKPRFLEKTPKNALRIPFLNEVFPDARYIYLFRDPRENISSIIDAWRSSDFVTYRQLPGWPGDWSLLLPPHYEQMKGRSLGEIAAFQWQAANQFILDDLDALPADHWTAMSYTELLADVSATIKRLCQFADLPFDKNMKKRCEKTLPLSRYTKTVPKANKWRVNEALIEPVMSGLRGVITNIEVAIAPHSSAAVLLSGPIRDPSDLQNPGSRHRGPHTQRQNRNERCDCGSGLRYKHCHGRLEVAEKAAADIDR